MLAGMTGVAPALIDEILSRIAWISGHQFRATMTAPQKALYQRLALAERAGDDGNVGSKKDI